MCFTLENMSKNIGKLYPGVSNIIDTRNDVE